MFRRNQVEEITPEDLKLRLDRGDQVFLLDVRQKWEADICRLDGSLLMPTDEVERRLDELRPESEIVVYCHHGVRSASVARYLRQRGFERVWSLAGGIARWAGAIDPAMPRY